MASAGKIIDDALDAGVEACLYAVESKPIGKRLIRAEESNNNKGDLPDVADPRGTTHVIALPATSTH